jgi:hypothetical protein
VNALINVLIHTDVQLFAAVAMGFIAAALIFLVTHDRFRIFARLRVNHMLRAVVVAYLVLLVYELALLGSMRSPGVYVLARHRGNQLCRGRVLSGLQAIEALRFACPD